MLDEYIAMHVFFVYILRNQYGSMVFINMFLAVLSNTSK